MKFENEYYNIKLVPVTNDIKKDPLITPKISVIVPVLNEEKILEQCLKLFTEETKRKYGLELIISDGGSSDRTIEIAKKYADKIVVHDKPYRQTIAEGRNRGAEIAEGHTFIFINGDTVPTDLNIFLEIIYNWSNSNGRYSEYSALACPVKISPEERIWSDRVFYTFHNNYVKILNSIGFGICRGECQVVKKTAFTKAGGYNNKIIAGEDFDFYKRLSKIGSVKFVKELVVYESPRRFRRYGYLIIFWAWIVNSLSVLIFGKSVSKEWEPVR